MNNGNQATYERTNSRPNRHRGSSLHAQPTQKRETGIIEKLLVRPPEIWVIVIC